jgi:hypothetical protein
MTEVQAPREAAPPATPAERAGALFMDVTKAYPASETAQGLAVLKYCRSNQVSPDDLSYPLLADTDRIVDIMKIANANHRAVINRREKQQRQVAESGNGKIIEDDPKRVQRHEGEEPPKGPPIVTYGETAHVIEKVFGHATENFLLPDEEVDRLLGLYGEYHKDVDGEHHRDEEGYRAYVAQVVKDNSPQGFRKR